MEIIENRMVVYPEQEPDIPAEAGGNLNGPGYREMGTGIFVPEEDAFAYALERVSYGIEEEKQEFVSWYFSGGWIKEDGSGAD